MEHIHTEEKITKKKPKQSACCCSHDEPVHSDNDGHDHGDVMIMNIMLKAVCLKYFYRP